MLQTFYKLNLKPNIISKVTSNLSKAHVTRDIIGSATWANSVQHATKIITRLEEVPKFEASVRMTT